MGFWSRKKLAVTFLRGKFSKGADLKVRYIPQEEGLEAQNKRGEQTGGKLTHAGHAALERAQG